MSEQQQNATKKALCDAPFVESKQHLSVDKANNLLTLTIQLPNACCVCCRRFGPGVQRFNLDSVCTNSDACHRDVVADCSGKAIETVGQFVRLFPMHKKSYWARGDIGENDWSPLTAICQDCFFKSVRASIKSEAFIMVRTAHIVRPQKNNCNNAHDDNDDDLTDSSMRRKVPVLCCPLCLPKTAAPLYWPALLKLFSKDEATNVERALDRFYVRNNNPVFHCPIVGCGHVEVRVSTRPGHPQRLHCAEHGHFCTFCCASLDGLLDGKAHKCCGLPAEVAFLAKEMRRCARCRLAITTTTNGSDDGYCCRVQCICGASAEVWPEWESIQEAHIVY